MDGGNARPVKRFFSFTTAQRNVKQKIADDSYKSLTLPKVEYSVMVHPVLIMDICVTTTTRMLNVCLLSIFNNA